VVKRTALWSIALAGVSIGLTVPREAGAVRVWEEARAGWTPPGGLAPGALSLGAMFNGPVASPDLRPPDFVPPLAAGGHVGASRFPEGVAERWLDIGIYTQPQFTFQTGYQSDSTTNFSLPPGVGVQRTRFIFHAQPHPLLQVRAEFNLSDRVDLLDAYALVPVRRWLQVQAGQFRVPFSRQELTSSSRLQFADRQLWAGGANTSSVTFIPSYDQGIMLWGWAGPRDLVEYYVGVFNGKGPNRPSNLDAFFLYAARVAVNPLGRPRALQEGAINLSQAPTLAIGLNGATQVRQVGLVTLPGGAAPVPNRVTVSSVGADVFFAAYGASAYGEVYFRDTHETDTASVPNTQSLGWLIQAGYFVPVPALRRHLEVVARAQSFDPSGCYTVSAGADCGQRSPGTSSREVYRDFMFARAYTIGLNWYQLGHGYKLQAQYTINTEHRDIAGRPPGSGVVDNDLFTLLLTGSL
jgi:hypothetical protein